MKVLVTGATGFLGRAMVGELLQNEFEVFTTAQTFEAKDLPNYFAADISDAASLNKLKDLGELDAIIHSAGLAHQFKETSREKFWKVNVEGTQNVSKLAAALNVKKFILISSVAVYGAAKQSARTGFEEDLPCQPRGFYAESKFEAEKSAAEICSNNSIDLTILRPSTIIGEDDRGNVARLIRAIDQRRFVWIGKGENLKSLIYKTDVARACLGFIESPRAAKNNKTDVYNVTAEPVSMREVIGEIEKALEKRVLPIRFPASPLQKSVNLLGRAMGIKKFSKLAETFDKWLSDDVFSGEKIRTEIGFQTAVAPLEGIRREALYYRKQK